MKKTCCLFIILIKLTIDGSCQSVALQYKVSSLQQQYAVAKLKNVLGQTGYSVRQGTTDFQISLVLSETKLPAEAFSITPQEQKILIAGGDERGLIYGCLSLAEDLRNGIPLKQCKPKNEKPRLALRAIKFDLPWDTYRHSYALSQHDQTCRDTSFWKAFLDMMVENRFNALSLWNLHPYPYLVKPKNFPEASPFTENELKEWQRLFHSIFRMAKERAIDTYIVPFNIFVTPEFARAHNVAMDNLQHDFFVRGDTSAIIKRYTRECVTQMLDEYPDLSGIGLTLGEGMAGMSPGEREDWIKETIIEGMRLAKRRSKLIHRIPFSSTTSSLGITNIETERLTRKAIEEEAAMGFTDGTVWADLKFNWSHAHSTSKLIKVHGGKLYDTYFNPLPTKYKITWTARNEDFFCLRWGVPSFIRDHINQNSPAYVGGYFIGSETYIPAKDYFSKDTISRLPWKYAFERQWLFYKLWGRLLYDPSTKDDVFKAEFIYRYGENGTNLLEASALAGKTPLRLASDFDLGWDFTLYSEGMMALDPKTKRVDYISADRLINQPPLDTDYVSVADYVKTITAGGSFDKKRITPLILAGMLEQDCNKALRLTGDIKETNEFLLNETSDIEAWAYLGLHFAEKLKGAVALQTYRVKGGEENKRAAIACFEKGLYYWDAIISLTLPLYKEMPLVHYSEQDGKYWKENDHLRFHWHLIRPDVAKDVETAKKATVQQ